MYSCMQMDLLLPGLQKHELDGRGSLTPLRRFFLHLDVLLYVLQL